MKLKRSWRELQDKFRHIGAHSVVAAAIASRQPQIVNDQAFVDLLNEAEEKCRQLREYCEERMT